MAGNPDGPLTIDNRPAGEHDQMKTSIRTHEGRLRWSQHRRIGFEDRETGDNIKGDPMKAQAKDIDMERQSNETQHEAADPVREPALDQDAVALLAYIYWEARGCPHDSSHEDWFRAAADIRNRPAAAAN
jgi:hypothetical protein